MMNRREELNAEMMEQINGGEALRASLGKLLTGSDLVMFDTVPASNSFAVGSDLKMSALKTDETMVAYGYTLSEASLLGLTEAGSGRVFGNQTVIEVA